MSSNGQWLLFSSDATNLIPGVVPGGAPGSAPNLFRKNLVTGAVDLAVQTNGSPNGWFGPGSISDDGNLIAFDSVASDIVGISPDPTLRSSAYLRHISSGAEQRLLYQPPGSATQGSLDARVSANGASAAFIASNGTGFSTDVVSCTLSPSLQSAPTCSSVGSGFPVFDLHLAASGTALEYSAANTPESGTWHVFRADLTGGPSGIASVNNTGTPADIDTGNGGGLQGISGDGFATFLTTAAKNLDPAATDGKIHAYLRISEPISPQPSAGFGIRDVQIVGARTDTILTRGIRFVPNDNTPISAFEFAWTKTPSDGLPGTIYRCASTITNCRLKFGATTPNTPWTLMARAIT